MFPQICSIFAFDLIWPFTCLIFASGFSERWLGLPEQEELAYRANPEYRESMACGTEGEAGGAAHERVTKEARGGEGD